MKIYQNYNLRNFCYKVEKTYLQRMRVWEVRDEIVQIFQFKTDFTDTKQTLNLTRNPAIV